MWSLWTNTGFCVLEEVQLGGGWHRGGGRVGSDQTDVAVWTYCCCFLGLLPLVLCGAHCCIRTKGLLTQDIKPLIQDGRRSSPRGLGVNRVTSEGRGSINKVCAWASSP